MAVDVSSDRQRIVTLLAGSGMTGQDRVDTALRDIKAHAAASARDVDAARARVEQLREDLNRLQAAPIGDEPNDDQGVTAPNQRRFRPVAPDDVRPGATTDPDALRAEIDEAQDDLAAKVEAATRSAERAEGAEDAVAEEVVRAAEAEDGQTQEAIEAAEALVEKLRKANDKHLENVGGAVWGAFSLASGAWVLVKLPSPSTWLPPEEWSLAGLTPDVSAALTALTGWVLLTTLMLLTRAGGGLRRVVIGQDGRFSTGVLQSVLWTAALFYALLFLTLRTAGDGTNPFDQLDATYLVLLGGPFAAAAAARASISSKVESGTVQSVPATTTAAADVVTDDGGNAQLVDIQFLAFNVIALVYFIGGLMSGETKKLPDLPEGLVALTSLGALTYATTKALARNAPVISAVVGVRGSGRTRPGDIMEIRGVNLVPPGANEAEHLALIRVRFGDVTARLVPQVTARGGRGSRGLVRARAERPIARLESRNRIRAQVPWSLEAGVHDVTVVTAAGVETEPVEVVVDAGLPTVLALIPEKLEPGGVLQIIGRSFISAGHPGRVTVTFNGRAVQAEVVRRGRSGVERLRAGIPHNLHGEAVAVGVVATSGEVSESHTVPLMT